MWLKLYLCEVHSRSLQSVKLEKVIIPRALNIFFHHKEAQNHKVLVVISLLLLLF